MDKILFLLVFITLNIQSQTKDFVIEYGVSFNELAIDTAHITNDEFKIGFLKSENESKRLLKHDRTLATLKYNSKLNFVTFELLELMDVDDQKSIYLAMKGVDDLTHDLKKNKITSGKTEIYTDYINWRIIEEFKNVIGYECQKAITTYTARNGSKKVVVAWFTTEIPIPSGPYIYAGLPGLILEVDNHLGRKIYARKIKYKKT